MRSGHSFTMQLDHIWEAGADVADQSTPVRMTKLTLQENTLSTPACILPSAPVIYPYRNDL